MKHVLTPLLLALLTAMALTSFASPAQVYAIPGTVGGVPDPRNVWEPYGPRSNLQFKFYPDDTTELAAFERGQIDLPSEPVPFAKWAAYDKRPDIVLSQAQGQFGMFLVDLNHESSTWKNWGCDFDHANSPCGIHIRQALLHLFDRPRFVTDSVLQGAGEPLADPTPPIKRPGESPLATQNSWDLLHTTITAYNIAPDPGGFAAPGSPDFCAARDHLIASEIGLRDDNNDCVIDNATVQQSNPIRFMIRNDHPPRRAIGLGLASASNQLFGADVVAETLGNIVQLGDIVFVSRPIDDWDMYTGGWFLGGFLPDHLRPLYHSEFASNLCRGRLSDRPLNYGFTCIREFDQHVDAASQTLDLTVFAAETLAALDVFGRHAANIPAYSAGTRSAVLRDVEGAVDARGYGYPNFWTLLNGRENMRYTPVGPDGTPGTLDDATYVFGGGSNMLRWGQSSGTLGLNALYPLTLADYNIRSSIYDTLIATSPIEPEKVISWMANRYEVIIGPGGNTTHIIFDLRTNLRWHDGKPVTAEDVKFSFLTFLYLAHHSPIKEVVVHGPLRVEIVLFGASLLHIYNTALPIVPKHLWDANNDGAVDQGKLDPSFDPLAAGILVGSGPWVCRSVFPEDLGRVGTGCARDADGRRSGQRISPGGNILLEAFDRTSEFFDPFVQYMRSYNPSWPKTNSGQFQEWSWADKNDNAKVDIVDVASVAACFGKTAPDSDCPADSFTYWDRLGTPDAITIEAVRVAARLDETWVDPYPWDPAALTNIVSFTP